MDEASIKATCVRLGKQLSEELREERRLPLFLVVMKGAVEFSSDLVKEVKAPLLLDYVETKSWEGLRNTGKVAITKDFSTDIEGRTVVVVEDIVESGMSMATLLAHIKEKGQPRRIIVTALFDKPGSRKAPVKVDYCGMKLYENKFLMGYGFDYKGLNRNVPYVYVPSQEEVDEMERLVNK